MTDLPQRGFRPVTGTGCGPNIANCRSSVPVEVDVQDPMVGIRAWRIANKELVSMWRETPWTQCLMWSTCPYLSLKHIAPDPECSCGIYAQYDIPSRRIVARDFLVWGVVSIWGKVIAHSHEVRAQYARIEVLAPHPCIEGAEREARLELRHLAARLRVRLTTFDRLKEAAELAGRPVPLELRVN
jgi:hypothetical protein